jgi:mRNA deadenylase 3'-5' endonuclease subunit Ccr4/uncharacterized protein with PIN domain
MQIDVVTWNVLADCYATEYKNAWEIRRPQIEKLLRDFRTSSSIYLLQEVDHFADFYAPLFAELGCNCEYVQRPRKDDGCLLCYDNGLFLCAAREYVYFDDLSRYTDASEHIKSSLVRQNVGVIAQLRSLRDSSLSLVVAVAHFYWNPTFPDIKSAQAEYMLMRLQLFTKKHYGNDVCPPIIFGGDFNITPDSETYRVLTSPSVLPDSVGESDKTRHDALLKIVNAIVPRRFHERCYYGGDKTKFLCDSDLSRFCRWLRLLGIDAAIDTSQNRSVSSPEAIEQRRLEKKKSKAEATEDVNGVVDYTSFFDRARREQRVILTTSKTMRLRAACPESMLISPKNMEESLVEVFKTYRIPIKRENFLTVCGKCGGAIVEVTAEEYREANEAFRSRQRADGEGDYKWLPTDRQIYMCVSCTQVLQPAAVDACFACVIVVVVTSFAQPYWWNESEKSSPARAMMLADRLHGMIVSALDSHRAAPSALISGAAVAVSASSAREAAGDSGTAYVEGDSFEVVEAVCPESETPVVNAEEHMQMLTLTEMFEARDKNIFRMEKYVARELSVSSIEKEAVLTEEVAVEAVEADMSSGRPVSGYHLSSAFSVARGSELPFTNWTESFKG